VNAVREGVSCIDWLGLLVFEPVAERCDLTGSPADGERAIAHFEECKFFFDGIAVRKLEPTVVNFPVNRGLDDVEGTVVISARLHDLTRKR
jgi:hypothetical protein